MVATLPGYLPSLALRCGSKLGWRWPETDNVKLSGHGPKERERDIYIIYKYINIELSSAGYIHIYILIYIYHNKCTYIYTRSKVEQTRSIPGFHGSVPKKLPVRPPPGSEFRSICHGEHGAKDLGIGESGGAGAQGSTSTGVPLVMNWWV